MTDYHPLIARAVDGLAKNTGDARRALYERARSALVAQLRGVQPALSESDITKERLALEEAIRKVEAEAARKAITEPKGSARTEPRFEMRSPPASSRPAEPSLSLPRVDVSELTAKSRSPRRGAGSCKRARRRSTSPGLRSFRKVGRRGRRSWRRDREGGANGTRHPRFLRALFTVASAADRRRTLRCLPPEQRMEPQLRG